MTAREKLKMLFAKKQQEEKEKEIKNIIERQIEEELNYQETIYILTNTYKPNMY